MNIEFPVFVLAKDSREIVGYDSVAAIQYAMERIDVENEEYEAWDAYSRHIKLKVEEPLWLKVEHGDEAPDEAGLLSHLHHFARVVGAKLDAGDERKSPAAIYEKIELSKPRKDALRGFIERF